MKTDGEKKNIKFGVALSYVSMVISILATLLFTNRILNYVGDYNYGLYSFVGSITSWLTIASSALNASFLRFTSIEAKQNANKTGRTNSIYLKLFTYISLAILGIGVSVIAVLYPQNVSIGKYSWEHSKMMYIMFAISIVNISITTAFTVFRLYINYKCRFIYEKTIAIVVTLLTYVGHFLIAYSTRNVLLISAYSLFVSLINICVNIVYAKKSCNIEFQTVSFKENSILVKGIFAFSGILIVNSIIDQVNSNLDKTLLGIFAQPKDITIYQMGMQFNSYLIIMVVAISSVFAPKINRLIVGDRKAEVDVIFLKISRIQSIVVSCIAFGFVACGKDFIIRWLGESRIEAYYVGVIIMLLNIMPLSVKTSVDIQRAMNKHYFRSVMYFSVAILNVILSIVFLKVFPARFAIYACLLGTVIASLITQWIVMNIYNYKVIQLPMKAMMIRLAICIGYSVICSVLTILVKDQFLFEVPTSYIKVLIEMTVFMVLYISSLLIFERKFILNNLLKRKLNT